MAFCSFCKNPDKNEAKLKSKMIDKLLKKDKKEYFNQVKLLLLGPGESGKSTFMKQMKIINGIIFNKNELEEYKFIIYHNIIRATHALLEIRSKLALLPWHLPNNVLYKSLSCLIEDTITEQTFNDNIAAIKNLWNEDNILKLLDNQIDCISYFKNHLDRIGSLGYIPNNDDILHCRKATRNIVEHVINIHGHPFRFVDVGGQRSQRQKWVQCFDGVTSIIFIIDSSSLFHNAPPATDSSPHKFYSGPHHQPNYPNALNGCQTSELTLPQQAAYTMTKIDEARAIFDTIVNNRFFANVSIILFLNKTDLLRKRIAQKHKTMREFPTSPLPGHVTAPFGSGGLRGSNRTGPPHLLKFPAELQSVVLHKRGGGVNYMAEKFKDSITDDANQPLNISQINKTDTDNQKTTKRDECIGNGNLLNVSTGSVSPVKSIISSFNRNSKYPDNLNTSFSSKKNMTKIHENYSDIDHKNKSNDSLLLDSSIDSDSKFKPENFSTKKHNISNELADNLNQENLKITEESLLDKRVENVSKQVTNLLADADNALNDPINDIVSTPQHNNKTDQNNHSDSPNQNSLNSTIESQLLPREEDQTNLEDLLNSSINENVYTDINTNNNNNNDDSHVLQLNLITEARSENLIASDALLPPRGTIAKNLGNDAEPTEAAINRELEATQAYLLHLFDSVRREPTRGRPLFHHCTTAVDTQNIERVFDAVKTTILDKNLKDLHLT